MLFKNSLFFASCFLSIFSLVSCNPIPANSNIKNQADASTSSKWNRFADFVGLQHMEDSPDLTNIVEITKYLSTPPENFHGKNAELSKNVDDAVVKFVIGEAANMQASKIVSIEIFGGKFLGDDSKEQGSNFISIPYFDRAGKTVDLSNVKTNSGIAADGSFSINQTVNGVIPNILPPLSPPSPATGKIYLMTYQLGGNENQNYKALVSIPSGAATEAVPLLMFAHGGDAGLVFKEMATLLQGNLGKFVVAAPVYPGEPICAVDFSQGTAEDNYTRSCLDHEGKITTPVVAAIGKKSPMKGDVESLLALQNGLIRLGNRIMESADGNNPFINNSPTGSPINSGYTIGVADSRGGGTLMASLGRSGLILKMLKECQIPGATCLLPKNVAENFNNYFSAAGFYYSPSSFLVGQFRFLTQYMMDGIVPTSFNVLPMVPEMTHYFDAYRNAPIDSPIEKEELQNLVGFMGASDITYLAPFVSIIVENWQLSDFKMPGSLIFIHGTQDTIVPFTESLIAKTAMDSVFENVYGKNASTSPLVAAQIPAVGSQLYSFQPDSSFYNIKPGINDCSNQTDASGNYAVNYNSTTNSCFGNFAGNDTNSTDHGLDPAFLTSHIENETLLNENINANGISTYGLIHELLYGIDPASDSNNICKLTDTTCQENKEKDYTFVFQFSHFENGVSTKYNIGRYSQSYCVNYPVANGACYVLANMSPNVSRQSFPLYYRSLGQDKTSINSNALLGTWSEAAQLSQLTPTDLMTSWLNTVVLDPKRGVFSEFKEITGK